MNHKETILNFLKRFFSVENLSDSTNIFENGFVNSLFTMQLIMFIENEFNISIEAEDMSPDNFDSIDHILGFIERKKIC